MTTIEAKNNNLEALREMVTSAVKETDDTDLLDLVWKLLALTNRGNS